MLSISVFGIFIIAVIFAVVTLVTYYLIYTRNINKKIQAGVITGKRMIDVPKMIMSIVIVLLVFLLVTMTISTNAIIKESRKINRNNFASIDISNPKDYKYASYFDADNLDDANFARVYSKDENPGYSKDVVVSGDYTFTVFTRSSPADSFHPDFLCFIDYTGLDKDKYSSYERASIKQKVVREGEKEHPFSVGGGGGNTVDKILYIGNLDNNSVLNITISLLDEEGEKKFNEANERAYKEDKGKFPKEEDFAVKSSTVTISID